MKHAQVKLNSASNCTAENIAQALFDLGDPGIVLDLRVPKSTKFVMFWQELYFP